jgi:hypothetical protein
VLDDFHEHGPQLGIEFFRPMYVRTGTPSNRAEPRQVRVEDDTPPQVLSPLLLRERDQGAQQILLCNPWLWPTKVEELQELRNRLELRNAEINYLLPGEDGLVLRAT